DGRILFYSREIGGERRTELIVCSQCGGSHEHGLSAKQIGWHALMNDVCCGYPWKAKGPTEIVDEHAQLLIRGDYYAANRYACPEEQRHVLSRLIEIQPSDLQRKGREIGISVSQGEHLPPCDAIVIRQSIDMPKSRRLADKSVERWKYGRSLIQTEFLG